jgi:hypothetical protein
MASREALIERRDQRSAPGEARQHAARDAAETAAREDPAARRAAPRAVAGSRTGARAMRNGRHAPRHESRLTIVGETAETPHEARARRQQRATGRGDSDEKRSGSDIDGVVRWLV